MPESLVLLHGFAGTRRAWDGVIAALDSESYRPRALDLPGHGAHAASAPISFASCAEDVLAASPPHFTLCGYSLGGRVALHVALSAPQRVRRLVLVSTSPGIEDAGERAARRASDEALAEDLERAPYGDFIERWRSQPLFADEPPRVRALARADHRRNRPRALAAALRGLGAGAMQPLWNRLGELAMPVCVLVGERDAKYRRIGTRMAALLPRGELHILSGGHGLVLESPAELAAAIESPP